MANSGSQLSLEILIKTIADNKGIAATEQEIKKVVQEFEAAAQAGKPLETNAETIAAKLKAIGSEAGKAKPPLDGLGNAGEKAGSQAADSSKHFKQLGEDFTKGAVAGNVLTQVLSGNFLAIGQLGSALKTFGVLLKTNLVGTLLTLGAVAAQFIVPFVAGFAKGKKSVEDLVAELEKAEETGSKFANASLTKFGDQMDLNRAKAEGVRNVLREILDLQGQRDEAQAAAARAKIDANPLLTEEQKTAQIAKVDDRLLSSQRARDDTLRNAELLQSAKEILEANSRLTDILNKRAEQEQKVIDAEKEVSTRAQKQTRLGELQGQLAASTQPGQELSAEQLQQNAEIVREIQRLTQELSAGKSESQLLSELGNAKAALSEFTKAADEADKTLQKVVATNEPRLDAAPEQQKLVQQTRTAEDEKRRVDLAQQQKAAIEADAKALSDFKAAQDELKAKLAETLAGNDLAAQRAAQKALSDFNASFKPGLTGADERKKLSDDADVRAFGQHQVENTSALDRATAGMANLERALYSRESTPNRGGTIIDQSGKTIDVSGPNAVQKAKNVDAALTDFFAPLDAQSSTVQKQVDDKGKSIGATQPAAAQIDLTPIDEGVKTLNSAWTQTQLKTNVAVANQGKQIAALAKDVLALQNGLQARNEASQS